jgi:hypothetical protein
MGCEANSCSISYHAEYYWILSSLDVGSGVGQKNRLTCARRGFGALKYDVRHAALRELKKNEIKHV